MGDPRIPGSQREPLFANTRSESTGPLPQTSRPDETRGPKEVFSTPNLPPKERIQDGRSRLSLPAPSAAAKHDPHGRNVGRAGRKRAADPQHRGKTPQHREVKGPIFVNGPNVADVDQGQLGDCWLMGGLASLAHTDPEVLRSAIKKNSDGTYTITFHEPGLLWGYNKVPIRVKNTFAAYADPTPNNKAELWVALIEKAYATWKGSYDNIDAGQASSVFEALTGKRSRRTSVSRSTSTKRVETVIRDAIKNDHPIAVGTIDGSVHSSLASDHTYSVLGIYERGGKTYVKLYNPWGPNDAGINRIINIPIDVLRGSIDQIHTGGS